MFGIENTTTAEDKKEAPSNGLQHRIKLLSYPVAATVGALLAKTSINDSAYDMLNKRKAFADIQNHYEPLLERIVKQGKKLIDAGEKAHIGPDLKKLNAEYAHAITARMEGYGLKGMVRQWDKITRSQKQQALKIGFWGASVTLGVALIVAQSKTLNHLFSSEKMREDQPSAYRA